MAKRSCNVEIFVEFQMLHETQYERAPLATGTAAKTLHGGPAGGNNTRRKARDQLVACCQALWDQRQLDAIPTPCRHDMNININMDAGDSFLDFIAELMYEEKGQPTKGDIFGVVRARIYGDKGCGYNGKHSTYISLGTIQIDVENRKIISGPIQTEFKVPQLPPVVPEPVPDPIPIDPNRGINDITLGFR